MRIADKRKVSIKQELLDAFKKHTHYAHNPPTGDAQYFNTRGGIRTKYLQYDGDWFYHNGLHWVYTETEPPVKTPIGEVEPLRVWYPTAKHAEVIKKEFNEGDYYSRFD